MLRSLAFRLCLLLDPAEYAGKIPWELSVDFPAQVRLEFVLHWGEQELPVHGAFDVPLRELLGLSAAELEVTPERTGLSAVVLDETEHEERASVRCTWPPAPW